jgi:hypothetical protein
MYLARSFPLIKPTSVSILSRVIIEEEDYMSKGEGKLKLSISLIRKITSYISNLLTYLDIEPSILFLTSSSKGLRLLLFDY